MNVYSLLYIMVLGQVESAFEFARICRKLDFHNFVFSMKASNPVVMVEAYRLLVAEMYVQGWDYPLHLGVTEAGEGEDGRMKSAIGIGTLLQVSVVSWLLPTIPLCCICLNMCRSINFMQ